MKACRMLASGAPLEPNFELPKHQCFCATAIPSGLFDPAYDQCTMTCSGNSGETCGGFPGASFYTAFAGLFRVCVCVFFFHLLFVLESRFRFLAASPPRNPAPRLSLHALPLKLVAFCTSLISAPLHIGVVEQVVTMPSQSTRSVTSSRPRRSPRRRPCRSPQTTWSSAALLTRMAPRASG